ncbi:MAG: ABC transporter permease [Candidatus Pacebacteria bacterium]|nr:ABC transporter permease [Candidatus Paceibacterota bacterium]
MRKAFNRIFRSGWLNFKRNSYLSFGTTGVMALVLLLFSGLMVLNYISSQIVTGLEDKVDVTAYFKNDASDDQVMAVKKDLESQPTIAQVVYISKEKALADFKEKHAGDALIQQSLAELSDNPLQASLNIKAKDSNQYSSVVTFLEGNKFRSVVDKINFYENEAVINRVQSISRGVGNWGLVVTLVLAFIAVMVTFNTIRLTIYNQKSEIEIMRLVGGSNWHIKAPYLIEGGLYGIFSATIAILVFYPTLWFISSKMGVLIPGISLIGYFVSNVFEFVPLLLVMGVALGVISSYIAIRRFLKV